MKPEDIKQARRSTGRIGLAMFLGAAAVLLLALLSRGSVRMSPGLESGASVLLQLLGVALAFFTAFQFIAWLSRRFDDQDLQQLAARGYELVGEPDNDDRERLAILPELRVNPHEPPLTGARKFRRGRAELIVATLAGSSSRLTIVLLPELAGRYVIQWRAQGADSAALKMLGRVVDSLRDIPAGTGLEVTAESRELRVFGDPPAELPLDALAGLPELAGCEAFGDEHGQLLQVRGETLCGREAVLDRHDRILRALGALD